MSTQTGGDRLKDLLVRAVEMPAGEREAFVRREAGEDEPLRERVMELLKAWDGATTALREPTRASLVRGRAAEFAGERVGDQIGAYTLVEKLGEGGFGVVYKATQESPVRRTLALKIVRAGMGSESVLARFDAERQALARLTHPSIARIFDAGTAPSGLPFFAMELVEGEPITAYCDRKRLGASDRVRLLVKVCQAVQHAHSKGIIHRDLKPSNILVSEVDGEATPKIIDFGIAKALDEPLTDVSMLTLAKQVIGTPRYMPPEQASLDPAAVDTRSDVYSLGVVLYELLTGTTPLTGEAMKSSGVSDLSRILSEGRFPAPSSRLKELGEEREEIARARSVDGERLGRTLSGELDWITMRAIEAEPSRRYQTAQSFARDMERYLNDEAVEARPAGRAYLARKFVRRHRVAVGAGTAVGIALVVGLGAALWALERVGVEQARTHKALQQVTQEQTKTREALNQAEQERDTAKAALDEAQGVTDFLSTMISAVDAEEKGRDVKVADLLDGAAADLEAGGLEASDAVKGRLHHVLGLAYWALGDWEHAESQLREAVAIRTAVYGAEHRATLSTTSNLASLVYERGDLAEALKLSEGLIEHMEKVYDEHDETYMGALGNYALMLKASGDVEGALAAEERLIGLNRDVFGEDGDRTIGAEQNLANTLMDVGRIDEAEALLTETLGRAERALSADAPTTLMVRHTLAMMYFRTGRNREAQPLMEQVLADRRRVFGDTHPNTLMSAYNLSANSLRLGETKRGEELLLEVIAACPEHIPARHQMVWYAVAAFPLVYADDWSGAPEWLAAKLVSVIRLANEGELPLATRNSFAMVLATMQPESARDTGLALEMARGVCDEAEASADPFLYGYLDTLSVALEAAGSLGEALEVEERAVSLCPADDQEGMSELRGRVETLRDRLAAAGGRD
ncbi:MAG: tetratricopeptide repeat protein [Phycisphaerales bacterium]